MCYSNSSTSKNIDLSKKYKKEIPKGFPELTTFYGFGFNFPDWRVVTSDTDLQLMKWGLVPSWFKNADISDIASKTLNARIESVEEKASFRSVFGKNNCIVPSTGFYEWHTIGKVKIPYFVYGKKDEILSMAGIFDAWKDPTTGNELHSFSILTCPANNMMAKIHNSNKRMPVFLSDDQLDSWLKGEIDAHELERPAAEDLLIAHEVDKKLVLQHKNTKAVQQKFDNGIYEQGSLF